MAEIYGASWPVQEAIHERLKASADYAATGASGPYDTVPDGTPYPYVSYGEPTEQPKDTFARRGWDMTLTLDVWSQADGKYEAYAIMAALNKALDARTGAAPLVVPGLAVYWLTCEFATVLEDVDGETRHGVLRYRIQASAA